MVEQKPVHPAIMSQLMIMSAGSILPTYLMSIVLKISRVNAQLF